MTGLPPRPGSLTIETDGSGEWGEDDLQTLANALGPQIMVVHMPPVRTLPWCSTDEQAGFTADPDTGQLSVRTTGPLTGYTAGELAAAIVSYLYYLQQELNPEGTS